MKFNRLFALMAMTSVMLLACDPVDEPQDDPNKDPQEQPEDPNNKPDDPNDEPEPEPVLEGYTAVNFEAVDNLPVVWNETDVIGIYPDEGAALPYTTTAEAITEEGKKGQFDGDDFEAEKVYAVYPYAEDVILVGNELELILPYKHVADKAGAPSTATNLRVAASTDKTLNFYNVLGYMKVNVTDSDVKEVVIRSLNAKNSLAGKATVVINDNAAPEVTVLDGVPHVILVPAEGQETIAPGVYYIPAVPAAMAEGVSVRFKTGGGLSSSGKPVDLMYVQDMPAVTLDRAGVADLGTLSASGSFTKFTEFIISSDASGFDGCYREFGSQPNIDVNPHNLWHAGDGDLTTYWRIPSFPENNWGKSVAYDINGNETVRGAYLRLDFNLSSQGPSKETCVNRVDQVIFEYEGIYAPDNLDLTGGHDWMPWTLDVREYSAHKLPDGSLKYGTLESLTVEESALPWTWEYNNYYVSKTYVKPYEVSGLGAKDFTALILSCTRTRDNIDGELMPKDAIDGVQFMNLAKEMPESQWGLAELRVYGHVRNK